MRLNVVMAYSDDLGSIIRAGTIVKWHKAEGDNVNYGDDLYDLRVEEVAGPSEVIHLHTPNQFARAAAEIDHLNFGAGPERRKRWTFTVRVTSSDAGVLKQISVQEGVRVERGTVLAEVESGDAYQDGVPLAESGAFRSVANAFHSPDEFPDLETFDANLRRFLKGPNYCLFWSKSMDERRLGIYFTGRHHLNAAFACAPLARNVIQGSCCIFRDGQLKRASGPPGLRSDMILQSLEHLPHNWLEPVYEKLWIVPENFRIRFFEPQFCVDTLERTVQFPKTVYLLSVVPDVVGRVYRHTEYGFLIDPCPEWTRREYEEALGTYAPQSLPFFQENFEALGLIEPGTFTANFTRIISLIRDRIGAQVVFFNTLTSAPDSPVHNYQLLGDSRGMRRLEFNLALAELSRTLDFPVIDVDRIVKRTGIGTQANWDHLDPALHPAVAGELFGVLGELRVFDRAPESLAHGL